MQHADKNTELYLTLFNNVFHCIIMVYMLLISYEYFPKKQTQLLVFIYLANASVRREESHLHNDSFMALFCVMAVYKLAVQDSPIAASLLLSAGISLKAGAVLYLPSFLGTIQYRYGIKGLI